jgi:phosphopantothenoylcysteine decarboxylase
LFTVFPLLSLTIKILAMDSQVSPTPFIAEQYTNDKKTHVLLAAATINLRNIAEALCRNKNISVRILVTEPAGKFLAGQSLERPVLGTLLQIDGVDAIYQDEDEWSPSWTRGGPVLHIELRKCQWLFRYMIHNTVNQLTS